MLENNSYSNTSEEISKEIPIYTSNTVNDSIPFSNQTSNSSSSNTSEDSISDNNHNYIDNNVFGFWNVRLNDAYNDKFFNINWTHYELIAKRDFNISDKDFSWDLVDQRLSDLMINPESDNSSLKSTIHQFNKLKKEYYNWINVLNDNGRYYWDIKLSDIDTDKDFQRIWDWESIREQAANLTEQNSSGIIFWEPVEALIVDYFKDKFVYYNNVNFTIDLAKEKFIEDAIAIKGKYKDYLFLMNNDFYFYDISRDKDFQMTINWPWVEKKIEILLNVTNEAEINMTEVDLKIKEYEFNSKPFSKEETVIIKELIRVERKYNEYLNNITGVDSAKNSTSNGLFSDIGNNIHQGTGMSVLLSM